MSAEEKQEFLQNMESILGYVDQIKKATVEGLPAQAGVLPEVGDIRNVMREDTDPHESGAYTDKILAQAPGTQDGFLKVKKILS